MHIHFFVHVFAFSAPLFHRIFWSRLVYRLVSCTRKLLSGALWEMSSSRGIRSPAWDAFEPYGVPDRVRCKLCFSEWAAKTVAHAVAQGEDVESARKLHVEGKPTTRGVPSTNNARSPHPSPCGRQAPGAPREQSRGLSKFEQGKLFPLLLGW